MFTVELDNHDWLAFFFFFFTNDFDEMINDSHDKASSKDLLNHGWPFKAKV